MDQKKPIFAPIAIVRLAHPEKHKVFGECPPIRVFMKNRPEEPVKDTKERRRKRRAPLRSTVKLPGTLGSTACQVQEPLGLHDMGVCILNALATRLPVRAICTIFGQKVPIELLGVVYRNHNLVWIIRSRLNDVLYLSSHFLADTIHIFEVCRARMPNPELKHNRQSFNNATRVNGILLANLCDGVTRLQSHPVYLQTARNFLRTGRFLLDLPVSSSPVQPSQAIVPYLRGWKVFAATQPMVGCVDKRRKKIKCICKEVVQQAEEDINDSTVPDGLLIHVPSSLNPKVLEHYK